MRVGSDRRWGHVGSCRDSFLVGAAYLDWIRWFESAMDAGEAIFAREERDMSPGCWTATAGLSVNCVWPSVLIEILTPPQRLLHCSLCQHVLVGRPIDHNNDLVVDVVLEERSTMDW